MDHVEEINVTLHVYTRHTRLVRVHACVQFFFIGVRTYIIGASLSEPHHVRSTVKSVFLLACLLACMYACHCLIWLSTNQKYIKSH